MSSSVFAARFAQRVPFRMTIQRLGGEQSRVSHEARVDRNMADDALRLRGLKILRVSDRGIRMGWRRATGLPAPAQPIQQTYCAPWERIHAAIFD